MPAYIVTSQWLVLEWNRAMSVVWSIEPPGALPFNIVTRMFADPALRSMHGERFERFAGELVAMVRATTASRFGDLGYSRMIEGWREDPLFGRLWDGFAVAHPVAPQTSTIIQSRAVGEFAYRTLTLDVPDDNGHWLVLQIPDDPSAARLREKLLGTSLADQRSRAQAASSQPGSAP